MGAALVVLDDLEDEAAGHRVGLGEAHGDGIAEPIDAARAPADQAVLRLLVMIVVPRQAADRHQPVGAALLERDEEPEAGDAVDAAGEAGADPGREVGGGIAVDGAALGGGGAALGLRDMRADRGEGGERQLAAAALAEILAGLVVAADQRAMDEEIGIAPDRRGEMRVAPQRQAEMADILGAVERLRLAAQD